MIVLNLVLIGLMITLEPIPLTAFILVLASKGGVQKGCHVHLRPAAALAIVISVPVLITGDDRQARAHPCLAAPGRRASPSHRADDDRRPAVPEDRQAEASESPQVADRHRRHDSLVRHRFGPLAQPSALVAAGVTVIVEAKLASWQDYLTLALFCVIATSSLLAMEIYTGSAPSAQPFLTRLRRWINTLTNQSSSSCPGPGLLADEEQHLLHRHLSS